MDNEAKEVGEEPSVTQVARVGTSFKMGYTIPTSVVLWSSSSYHHYSWAKLVSTARKLVGFPTPEQLSCDNHPFFEVFIHWL